ncbi:MAG: hypothetical protein A3G40_15485 [Deltaproteobacteria bacterium RIFCSPLOWO2_12_FULL_57_22]|nr:MAG: hypothetical protein A3G40_15485 [Deltaproteobacteria bacterium RIFCSPLOWO2_12_FULL_57_22]
MRRRITKAQARAFRERWEAVNALQRRELRQTPLTHKLQQLNALMAWGKHLGWTEPHADGAGEVRRRWKRLFRAYRG